MADTALKTEEEKREYFDSPEELDQKCEMLANMILSSEHFVAFTGAGISTSTGIPDFRSGVNTVLPTGPGAWEKAATKTNKKPLIRTSIASAIPSPTHMALVELERAGFLKFLISQNVDGLHRKSGFPSKKLAELHGNTNLEVCGNPECKKQYLRDFRVRTAQEVHDHRTGRLCERCGNMLYDSIVNFGESLPKEDLNNGFKESAKADLCLVLGSSLRVTPAADMPLETVQNGGKLVIVNLQATPLDDIALKINGMIDDVMTKVMDKLELIIPPFSLIRRMKVVKTDRDLDGKKVNPSLLIRGIDEDVTPYSLFKSIEVTITSTKENFYKNKDPAFMTSKGDLKEGKVFLQIEFQGHYDEPAIAMDIDLSTLKMNQPKYFLMEFDPFSKKWLNIQETTLTE